MNSQEEVIALLLGEPRRGREPVRGAQTLVRDSSGNIALRAIETAEEFDETARTTGCFRQGRAIYDPETREVIGYELEEVPTVSAAMA